MGVIIPKINEAPCIPTTISPLIKRTTIIIPIKLFPTFNSGIDNKKYVTSNRLLFNLILKNKVNTKKNVIEIKNGIKELKVIPTISGTCFGILIKKLLFLQNKLILVTISEINIATKIPSLPKYFILIESIDTMGIDIKKQEIAIIRLDILSKL